MPVIDFEYDAVFVRQRKRTEERTRRRGQVKIDFNEVSPEDRELVCEAGVEPQPNERTPFRLIDGRPGRVWKVDGRFFAERCPLDRFDAETLRDKNDNDDVLATRHDDLRRFPAGVPDDLFHYKGADEIAKELKCQLSRWDDDGGIAKGERIARHIAASCIVADGMVCLEVGEPCFVLDNLAPEENAVRLTIEEVRSANPGADINPAYGSFPPARFRLDRKDEALAAGRALAESADARFDDATVVASIRTDLLTFHDDPEALWRAAVLASAMAARDLPMMSRSVIEAYYPLRDALATHAEDFGGEALAAAADTMRSALAAEAAKAGDQEFWSQVGRTPRYSGGKEGVAHDDLRKIVIATLTSAVDRWSRRAARPDAWIESALPLPCVSLSSGRGRQALCETDFARIAQAGGPPVATMQSWLERGLAVISLETPQKREDDRYDRSFKPEHRRLEGVAGVREIGDGFVVEEIAGLYGRAPTPQAEGVADRFASINGARRRQAAEVEFDAAALSLA